MKRQAYYPSRIADQLIWLKNFHNKLGNYQATLGLTSEQVNSATADGRYLVYVFGTWLATVRPWALSCTKAANDAMTGMAKASAFCPSSRPQQCLPMSPP